MSKRYQIQVAMLDDTLSRGEVPWYTCHRHSARTLRTARKNFWYKASTNQNRVIYRIFDTKTGKVVS